jgi:phage tail-like protein
MFGIDIPFLDDPVPNFYFGVIIVDNPLAGNGPLGAAQIVGMLSQLDPIASAFTEVSGLSLEIDTDSVNEAANSIAIPLPKSVKNDTLVLKRYVRPRHIGVGGFSADPLTGWCQDTFEAAKQWKKSIKPKDVMIMVLHPHLKNIPLLNMIPVAGYLAKNAYPTKWEMDSLNSTSNDALQETIELKYRELQRLAVPPV